MFKRTCWALTAVFFHSLICCVGCWSIWRICGKCPLRRRQRWSYVKLNIVSNIWAWINMNSTVGVIPTWQIWEWDILQCRKMKIEQNIIFIKKTQQSQNDNFSLPFEKKTKKKFLNMCKKISGIFYAKFLDKLRPYLSSRLYFCVDVIYCV